jgi:putative membrane protein
MMGGGLILTLLVLGVVVWAIIKFVPDWQHRLGLNNRREDRREDRHEGSAEEILRQRFARGEIDAEEYEQRLRVLWKEREESPAAHRANADGGSPSRPMPPGE